MTIRQKSSQSMRPPLEKKTLKEINYKASRREKNTQGF